MVLKPPTPCLERAREREAEGSACSVRSILGGGGEKVEALNRQY
jgi:hypothetical protein